MTKMDAFQHTIWTGAWTVSGAYFQSGVGFPIIGSVVSPALKSYVGGFADVVLAGAVFVGIEKFAPDSAGWQGELKDGAEAFCLGYGLSAVLSFVGL